ncbi:MAG: tyrosine-type recombinase/integrase [Lachnospiraceae bacterium]|nr:tyrosine-type recombinase/integrase [Lachnospiraceae bacterium]
MAEQQAAGVYQLDNGYWGYRFVLTVNGKKKAQKRVKDELGNPYKTQKQAAKARNIALAQEQAKIQLPQQKQIIRQTVAEVYQEYCEKGRSGKAYATIKKQDSLWNNHIKEKFGKRYIDEITVAEIQDYLEELYYTDNRAYSYTESFLKMFYLIFGQAYSRNYIDVDSYNKLCINKDTKIHMPKLKIDDDLDIVSFDDKEIEQLDNYFSGTNAETAYMLGKYCGLRINECYGLKWSNVDLKSGIITIDRQMQYQNGLIKLVSLKTRNAKRKIYMCNKLKEYFKRLKRQQEKSKKELALQRQQNQTFIQDLNGDMISSLELVNSLPNGKIQTVNSMKYHSRTLQGEHNIMFKYHYLRHTYGTNLAALNTPEYLLCNQMGHANSNVTHKYYVAISERGVDELLKNLEKM